MFVASFLVSFLVDARGGAMRGCRQSGVRIIVPPLCAASPTRVTCRYVRPQRTPHPPPLMEGEALASRILELGPVGVKFLGPVIIEVPHFAALRGKEREIVVLRSDNGETWKEHTADVTDEVLSEVLHDSFDTDDLNQLDEVSSGRMTRIVTQDFPQYFAVITRIRQEVHVIGPDGGMVSSTVVPQVQAVFPQGALTKKIKVGLQAQPIDPELTAKLLGHGVAVSPIVTVEPRRRKFHKAITLSIPAPRPHSQGMINQYSGSTPTLRLLCSITGGTTRAQWEDVTGSTPLTFVNDCVSFTTTVSARFWLMDCRNVGDATKMASDLYREAIHVPFMAKFVVFAKRVETLEGRLRVFCMTDDKEDKTLEQQEHFTEVAKSRDVEVLEGKTQYLEFAGNLIPITKSGEQLQFSFRAFRENRLPFSVRVKDQHAEALGRCMFMREAKVPKGELPQQPICILNIALPDDIVVDTISLTEQTQPGLFSSNYDYGCRPDPRLTDISNLLGEDWVELAKHLDVSASEIGVIRSEYPDSVAKQAQSMLRLWLMSQSSNRAQSNTFENALRKIGRDDVIEKCLKVGDVRDSSNIAYRSAEYLKSGLRLEKEDEKEEKENKKDAENDKYSAEEKAIEHTPSDTDEEEHFKKSVTERRTHIEKRLSMPRFPASAQRVEIVQEITSIKRQSLVEDKIAVVEQKNNNNYADNKKEAASRRDSTLMEEVTHRFDLLSDPKRTHSEFDSAMLSKTPPPSPADFFTKDDRTPNVVEAVPDDDTAANDDITIVAANVCKEEEVEEDVPGDSDVSDVQSEPLQAEESDYRSRQQVCKHHIIPLDHAEPRVKQFFHTTSFQKIDSFDATDSLSYNMSKSCSNTLELLPSSDALIEIPVIKSYRTSFRITVSNDCLDDTLHPYPSALNAATDTKGTSLPNFFNSIQYSAIKEYSKALRNFKQTQCVSNPKHHPNDESTTFPVQFVSFNSSKVSKIPSAYCEWIFDDPTRGGDGDDDDTSKGRSSPDEKS